MLHLRHYPFELAFKYPFTTYKGTKTHQPVLVVALGLGRAWGVGEVGAISYYNITVPGMQQQLEANRAAIERYALTTPDRFWHFLHHLIPGQNFLTAALDIAAWEYGVGAKVLAGALAGRSFLAADAFSVADILAGHVLMWARSARLDVHSPVLEAYVPRLESRPALQRAQERAHACS